MTHKYIVVSIERVFMTNILLLGDSGVGKSSYLGRLIGTQFSESYIATLGKDMNTLIRKDRTVFVHDIGGSDRFMPFTEGYFKCADGALIFYDVSDEESYNRLKFWKNKLPEHVPTIIVANKNDIQQTEAKYSISCKKDKTVDNPLNALLDQIPPPLVEKPTILNWVWDLVFYYLGVIR